MIFANQHRVLNSCFIKQGCYLVILGLLALITPISSALFAQEDALHADLSEKDLGEESSVQDFDRRFAHELNLVREAYDVEEGDSATYSNPDITNIGLAKRIYFEGLAYAEQRLRELGVDRYIEELERGNIKYTVVGLGDAKFSFHGKKDQKIVLCRVVLAREKLAFFFINDGKIPAEMGGGYINPYDPHLRKHMARQKMNRERDVVVVNADGNKVELEYSPRARAFTIGYVRDFLRAVWDMPTWGNVKHAGVCAALQMSIVSCLNIAQGKMSAGLTIGEALSQNAESIILTGVFASVVGILYSTYKNLVDNGNKLQRFIKASMVGGLFSFSFVAMLSPTGWAVFNPFNADGLATTARVSLNVALSQYAKDDWFLVYRTKEAIRAYVGTLRIAGRDTGIKKSHWVRQNIYHYGSYPLKIVDLLNLKILGFPIGKVLFYGSFPVIRFYSEYWHKAAIVSREQSLDHQPSDEMQAELDRIRRYYEQTQKSIEELVHHSTLLSLGMLYPFFKNYYQRRQAYFEYEAMVISVRKLLYALKHSKSSQNIPSELLTLLEQLLEKERIPVESSREYGLQQFFKRSLPQDDIVALTQEHDELLQKLIAMMIKYQETTGEPDLSSFFSFWKKTVADQSAGIPRMFLADHKALLQAENMSRRLAVVNSAWEKIDKLIKLPHTLWRNFSLQQAVHKIRQYNHDRKLRHKARQKARCAHRFSGLEKYFSD